MRRDRHNRIVDFTQLKSVEPRCGVCMAGCYKYDQVDQEQHHGNHEYPTDPKFLWGTRTVIADGLVARYAIADQLQNEASQKQKS